LWAGGDRAGCSSRRQPDFRRSVTRQNRYWGIVGLRSGRLYRRQARDVHQNLRISTAAHRWQRFRRKEARPRSGERKDAGARVGGAWQKKGHPLMGPGRLRWVTARRQREIFWIVGRYSRMRRAVVADASLNRSDLREQTWPRHPVSPRARATKGGLSSDERPDRTSTSVTSTARNRVLTTQLVEPKDPAG